MIRMLPCMWLVLLLPGRWAPGAESLPAESPAEKSPPALAIRASRIYTPGEVIEGGTILISGGKISAVGRDLAIPPGVEVLNLPGRSVIPGLIDSHTTLAEGGQDSRRSISPEILALDGWDFFADRRPLLAGGVTAVYVSTGENRLVSGRGLVVKTGGHGNDVLRRVLRRAGGLRVALGEYSKNPPAIYNPPVPPSADRPFRPVDVQLPTSRAGEFMALRSLLRRGREYLRALTAWRHGTGKRPEPDPGAESLLEVLAGRDCLRVRVDRAHDIQRILALAGEMRVPLVLEGAREGYRIPELIARAGARVIFRGEVRPGQLEEEDITRPTIAGEYRRGTAALLVHAGIPLAIDSPSDRDVAGLLLGAAGAVREGLSPEDALRAITLTAAEILGVETRVGRIAPGMDADLVVLAGERIFGGEPGSPPRPEAVYIDGELVYTPGPGEVPRGSIVIRCGRILTARREIAGGIIVVKDGKILHVGPGTGAGLPEWARVIDASDEVVIPGLIDAGGRAGVHADVLTPTLADEMRPRPATGGGGRATYRLADAIDPGNPAIRTLLRSGLTSLVLTPDAVGSSVAGQITVMKLSGEKREKVILKDPAGLLFARIRTNDLKQAREYHDRWSKYEEEAKKARGKDSKPKPPDRDENLEPFRLLYQKKAVAVAVARSRGEIPSLLEELINKQGFSATVYAPPDLDAASLEEVRKRGGSLILQGAGLIIQRPPGKGILNLPALAAQSGVRFAIRSGAASGARQLPLDVANAVREGWSSREALRAMTLYPARIFGIDDRIGSIEKGKDADLVFLTGDPFSFSSRVRRVMVDGELVFQEGN